MGSGEGKPRSERMESEPSYLKLNNLATIPMNAPGAQYNILDAMVSESGLRCILNVLIANVVDAGLHSTRIVLPYNLKIEWHVEQEGREARIVRYQESNGRKVPFIDQP